MELSEQHRDTPGNRYSDTMENINALIEGYCSKHNIDLQGSSKALVALNGGAEPTDFSEDELQMERAFDLIYSGKQDLHETAKMLGIRIRPLKAYIRKRKLVVFGGKLAAAYKEFKLLKTDPEEICNHYGLDFKTFQKYALKKRKKESLKARRKRGPSKYD